MNVQNSRNAHGRTQDVSLAKGDCLKRLAKLPDASVDLVLTDLPYGTTKCPWDSVIDLAAMWRELYRVGKPDCVFLFTAQAPFTFQLAASNPHGLKDLRHTLVWEKPNGTNPFMAKRAPMKVHEDILVYCRKAARYIPQMEVGTPYVSPSGVRTKGQAAGTQGVERQGGQNLGTRYPRSVLRFAQDRGWHPTQKPVALMRWLIDTYSKKGQVVLDLTMGSGTTGVAAVQAGRKFVGFEMDAAYMAVARKRIRAAQRGKADLKGRASHPRFETLRGSRGFGKRSKGVRRVA